MLSEPLLDASSEKQRAPSFFCSAAILIAAILLFTLGVAIFITLTLPPNAECCP